MTETITKSESLSYRTAYRETSILIGLPFSTAGAYLTLVGAQLVPSPGQLAAPLWVITCTGLAIGLSGLLVVACGVLGTLNHKRTQRFSLEHPDKPWLGDYPWKPFGIRDNPYLKTLTQSIGWLFLAIFAAPFHWWAFEKDVLAVRAVVIATDAFLAFGALRTLLVLVRAVHYGKSQLRFSHFPFFLGEKLDVTFSPNRFDKVEAELRFVEERFEFRGKGRNRRRVPVFYSHYRETKTIHCHRLEPEVSLSFDLPEETNWKSRLSDTPASYWEILLRAQDQGIEFNTTFLLPVYAPTEIQDVSSKRVERQVPIVVSSPVLDESPLEESRTP